MELVALAVAGTMVDPSSVGRWLLIAGAAVAGTGTVWAIRVLWQRDLAQRTGAEAHRRVLEERIDSLEASTASKEAMLASMQEGIVLFGPDLRVVYANPAARDLLGRRLTEASEMTPQALRDAVRRVDAGEGSATVEFETTGRAVEALVLPGEETGGALVVARDVTAARRTDQLRRDFVANASHELKTPVASILALAATLDQASGDTLALRRFLDHLETEAERLSRLVADLLDLSRLESGLAEPRPVRLDAVAKDEASKLALRAKGADLRIVVEEAEATVVSGSELDLGLMMHNLLDNAIRYTPPGGQVTLAVRRSDGMAQVRVDDTGIGIPSADLDRVFERFYRVDAARSRQTGGTGLGLSIVRHVAEAHHGSVHVRSVLGSGSTFVVELPLAGSQPA